MKIGIESDAYWDEENKLSSMRRARSHGWECVDYQKLVDIETPFFRLGESAFERAVTEDRGIIEEAGLEISQTHGPWRYPPRDGTKEDRQEWFDKMARALRATRLLGCGYMVIHPLMPFGTGSDGDRDEYFAVNGEFYRGLCTEAAREGVVICLENMPMPDLPLASPGQILDFVRKIGHPNLRVCLDTGHSVICSVPPGDAVRLLGKEWMRVVHVHDNDGRGDRHWLPYTGVIDWEDFSRALHEIGFEGTVSVEAYVKPKMPSDLLSYHQIGLALMARRLAM